MNVKQKAGAAIASLLIAFVLWVVVHNLDRSSAVFTVPITHVHPAAVVRLEGSRESVEIRVRATKPKLRTLRPQDFDVRVDNQEGSLGEEVVFLDTDDVDAPFGVLVESVTPSQFRVAYDALITQQVPVAVSVAGTPAAGYEVPADGLTAAPATVRVTGPRSLLDEPLTMSTAPLDVQGRDAPVTARLALLPPTPGVVVENVTHVTATAEIRPRIGRRVLDAVPVTVVRGAWQTSPPNPRVLRVTVEGPEPRLTELDLSHLSVTADVRGLEPSSRDYFIDVAVAIDGEACPGCVEAGLSQRKVHVNVSRTPRRASEDAGTGEPGATPAAGAGPSSPPTPPGESSGTRRQPRDGTRTRDGELREG